jgi:purine-binding chemotaxis protein CheW
MNADDTLISETAAGLRLAFDRSFSDTTRVDIAVVETLLAVRVGSHPYVLRLTEVSGLFVDKKITWLPSPVSELLGIAAVRGKILPIYDLAMLLGCPRASAPRWLLVTADTLVGLAFEDFDGYLSVRRESIVADARVEGIERHVREILRTDIARPIIHLSSVLETIGNRGGDNRQT